MIVFNSLSHAHLTEADRIALERNGLELRPIEGQPTLHFTAGNSQPAGQPVADFSYTERPGDYRTEYSPAILNRLNRIAYSLPEQHEWMAQQIHYLSSPPFILALTRLIRQQYKQRRIVVAELAGGDCSPRWSAIAQALPDRQFEVHVYDVAAYNQQANANNLSLHYHHCNLPNDVPSAGYLFDLFCCFYGADSFWGPDDYTYYQHDNQWWQRSWRLRVPGWYERRDLLIPHVAADHSTPRTIRLTPRDLAVLGIEWRWTPTPPPADICTIPDLPSYVTPPRTLAHLYGQISSLLAERGLFLCGDVSLGEKQADAGLYNWGYARYQFVSLWALPTLIPSLGYQSLGSFLHNWRSASLPTREELTMAPLLADLWDRSSNHEGVVLGKSCTQRTRGTDAK